MVGALLLLERKIEFEKQWSTGVIYCVMYWYPVKFGTVLTATRWQAMFVQRLILAVLVLLLLLLLCTCLDETQVLVVRVL